MFPGTLLRVQDDVRPKERARTDQVDLGCKEGLRDGHAPCAPRLLTKGKGAGREKGVWEGGE